MQRAILSGIRAAGTGNRVKPTSVLILAHRRAVLAPVTPAPAARRARPTHLVVFRAPSAQNAQALTEVLKARDAGRTGAQGVVRAMRLPDQRELRMHERIAVAAATLVDQEVAALRARGDLEVVDNHRRSIPRPVPSPKAPTRPVRASDTQTVRLVAYLRGVIDASENALRFLGQVPGSAAPTWPVEMPMARALDAADLTWALSAIGVSTTSLTGRGVTVALLDTGVDLTHPDLVQHFPTMSGTAVFVPDVDSVQDGHGHGTHCAGVIAGSANPRSGPRYSVAPEVTLLVGKVLDDEGSGFDDGIVEGIEWASQMGAAVISMSLGSVRSAGALYSPLYERVGSTLLDQGTLLVAAAGNESHRPSEVAPLDNPAACPSFMAIGAVDSSLSVGWFSCGNVDHVKDVDLAAPGVAIQSAWTGGGYQLESGTSMATPHVAGAAALWAQSAELKGQALRDQLKSAARPLGSASDFGTGLVQVPAS